MSAERKRFSVKTKMYIFVVVTVLSVAVGTSLISYSLSIDQLDHYYKQSAADNARNINFFTGGRAYSPVAERTFGHFFSDSEIHS